MSDDIKKKIYDLINNTGITKFELQSRRDALEILFATFYKVGMQHFRSRQLSFLLEPDSMSNDEWVDYIQLAFIDAELVDWKYIN